MQLGIKKGHGLSNDRALKKEGPTTTTIDYRIPHRRAWSRPVGFETNME